MMSVDVNSYRHVLEMLIAGLNMRNIVSLGCLLMKKSLRFVNVCQLNHLGQAKRNMKASLLNSTSTG